MVHADRRRGKPHSRLLYWFRTPPGVRVGRAALDEDAIRLIEEHNPDVAFDWTRILKGEPAPPEPRPRQDLQERRPPRAQRQRSTAPTVTAPAAEPERVPDLASPDVQASSISPEPVQVAPVSVFEVAPVPAFDEDGTPTDAMAEERGAEPAETPPTAAMARLGAEGLLRLRARHSEVLARISEKVTEPVRRDELKSQADRLNPDTWVTDSDVTAGLEQYETVFESLRSVVGRRRKRRRRRSSPTEAASPGSPESSAESAEAEDDGADDEL